MFRFAYVPIVIALCLPILCLAADTDRAAELIEAARQGNTERVKQLLAHGVDINARGRFNITPAWQAASRGHRQLLKFLVENGADVNLADSVWHVTPFMMVSDPDTVALLMNHGAKGVEAKLNQAALYGHSELVKTIVTARRLDPQCLAEARAQAEIGKHEDIIKLLEQAAEEPLPPLPSVPENTLRAYAGQYLSDRLHQVQVVTRDGRLFLKEEASGEHPLVAIDQQTFAFGATRFRFEVINGKVTALVRKDLYSSRRYTPRSTVLIEGDNRGESGDAAPRDDPRLLARNHWPSFRGIEARGIAVDQDLPDDWNVEEERNVRWKTPIAGLGNSCPIVWGNRIFVTTALSGAQKHDLRIGTYGAIDAVEDQSKHSWRLMCIDAANGELLWTQTAHEGVPNVKRHLKSTQANSTPATDGRHVVALFNFGGLYCYDFDGRLLWSKHLGVLNSGAFHDPDIQWGFGSSPIIYRDTVIVQCDLQEDSFIAAYDIKSGTEIWKWSRDEQPSWGTPTVFESPYGPLLLTNGTNFARAYDALSGRERWRLSGNAAVTVPTPLVAYGLIFITSGYRPIQPIFAVRLDAQGDISLQHDEQSNSGVAWSKLRGGPYLPTPIAYRGYLYTCGNNGILTCYEAKSGKQVYRKRAARGAANSFVASPVAADGRVYLTAESGDVLVVKAGPKFEILNQCSLGDYCLATPAIAGRQLIARTHTHLVAIGKPQSSTATERR